MSLVWRVARRFVLDQKTVEDPVAHGFVSFIALISISGLALGVTALLVVTSVMNGFEREIKRALTSFHGHILLFSRNDLVDDAARFMREVPREFPDVTGISPYLFAEVMLSSDSGVAGSVVEGVDLATVHSVSGIPTRLREGRLPAAGSNEVVLGSEVARRLKVSVGDTVRLTVPYFDGREQSLVEKLSVSGILHLGMYEYDNKYALMECGSFQRLLRVPGKVNAFKILTRDAYQSRRTTQAINEKYVYPMRARDWSSLNQNLFEAIRLEKAVIAVILFAIVIVASFNVISTVLMMVHDKSAQISMLRALGLARGSIFGLFLAIGFVLSVLGALLGLGLGRALCAVIQWKSLIDLHPDIYIISKLPVEIRPVEWAAIAVFTVLLALGATLIPSYRISRRSPVEGIRYE